MLLCLRPSWKSAGDAGRRRSPTRERRGAARSRRRGPRQGGRGVVRGRGARRGGQVRPGRRGSQLGDCPPRGAQDQGVLPAGRRGLRAGGDGARRPLGRRQRGPRGRDSLGRAGSRADRRPRRNLEKARGACLPRRRRARCLAVPAPGDPGRGRLLVLLPGRAGPLSPALAVLPVQLSAAFAVHLLGRGTDPIRVSTSGGCAHSPLAAAGAEARRRYGNRGARLFGVAG
jgi:hypothetical protein